MKVIVYSDRDFGCQAPTWYVDILACKKQFYSEQTCYQSKAAAKRAAQKIYDEITLGGQHCKLEVLDHYSTKEDLKDD